MRGWGGGGLCASLSTLQCRGGRGERGAGRGRRQGLQAGAACSLLAPLGRHSEEREEGKESP